MTVQEINGREITGQETTSRCNTRAQSRAGYSDSKSFFLCCPVKWIICALVTLWTPGLAIGQEKAGKQPADENAAMSAKEDANEKNRVQPGSSPLAQYVTLDETITDQTVTKIRNLSLKLQSDAIQEDRPAYLVIEVRPAASELLQAMRIAKDLTSSNLSRVKTVAWVPQTLTGSHVIVALGCKEIVIQPDAVIGDIGQGKSVELGERQSLLDIIDKRYNPKLSRGLVIGMLDPVSDIRVVTIDRGQDNLEQRVVTREDQQELVRTGISIKDFESIKEPGEQGTFSANEARALGFLIHHIASSRDEVAQLYGLPAEAMREDFSAGEKPSVRPSQRSEPLAPVTAAFIERQIQRALSAGANTLVFQIKSPGGYLLSGENLANRIMDLREQKVHTIAYIPEQAYSAAAIVALACDDIYIVPSAQIGDAGPMEIHAGGQFERVPEKILSPLKQRLKSIAEAKGRPPALLQAMSDKDLLVYQVTHRDHGRIWYLSEEEIHASNGEWIQGRLVPETDKNELLTVTGDRAVDLKLATAVVADDDELIARLGMPPGTLLMGVERTWIDTLVFFLSTPSVAGFLLFLGIMFLYIEAHFFTGFFGILSTVCFAVFFWSKFLGGTAGWLEVILFLLGAIMLLLEIFVIPGFGVFGISGILLILGSLVMAFQSFGNYESGGDWYRLLSTLGTLSGTLLAVIVMGVILSSMLPSLPIFRSMVLVPDAGSSSSGPRLRPDLMGGTGSPSSIQQLTGMRGKAVTLLRPAGKVRIDGDVYEVFSEGPLIPENADVEVVSVRGRRIEVREIV